MPEIEIQIFENTFQNKEFILSKITKQNCNFLEILRKSTQLQSGGSENKEKIHKILIRF